MLEKIREGLKENKKIIWIILSIICIIGFNMTIDTAKNTINFNGNQMIWLILCISFYFIFKYSSKLNNKRLSLSSLFLIFNNGTKLKSQYVILFLLLFMVKSQIPHNLMIY